MASEHRHQESGTVNPILKSTENFAHEADTLLLQAEIAKKAASALRKNQKKIDEKLQQTKSKNLQKYKEKYKNCLVDIRDAVNRMQDTLSDGGSNEMKLSRKREFSRSINAPQRERNKDEAQTDTLRTLEIESMMYIKKDGEIQCLQDELESTEKCARDADTLLLQAKIAKEAASVLRVNQKKIVKKQQQTTSKNLQKCIEKCNSCLIDIRDAVNRMQDTLSDGGFNEIKLSRKSEFSRSFNAPKGERNRPRAQTDTLRTPQIKCMMCMKKDGEIKKLQDELESLKQIGKAYDEIHQKYQDEREQCGKYQRLYKEEQEGKEDALRRLSSIASSKLRDNNPNIADLSDQFRPTKIAEMVSELYDNEWTDAYSVLEKQGLGEKQIIESLLDMFMAAYTECRKLASENFFESVQRCIEIPTEGSQLPVDYKVVMQDQLKQQVKEFRKVRARHVVKEIEMIVRKRITSKNKDLDAIYVYLSHCIEIAWFCAVQDPPVVVKRDAPVKFDTNTYKDYTRRGQYTEFVVWPALYLHDGGALLSKGIAQGTDIQSSGSKAAAASGEKSSASNEHGSCSSAYLTVDAKSHNVTTIKEQMLDSKGDGPVHNRENEARDNMTPRTQQQHDSRTTSNTDDLTKQDDQTSYVTDL